MAAPGGVQFLVTLRESSLALNAEVRFHKTCAETLTVTSVGKSIDLLRLQAGLQVPSHEEIADVARDIRNLHGGLWFNKDKSSHNVLYCVFLIRTGEKKTAYWYWVLLVVPTENEDEYRRVGVGQILIDWVTTAVKDVQIV